MDYSHFGVPIVLIRNKAIPLSDRLGYMIIQYTYIIHTIFSSIFFMSVVLNHRKSIMEIMILKKDS
jgi:hypothetical protein